ncbi:MAG: peptidoglycan editing factor PgeF [Clostridia bacterium]|nr:peptidoglycan editing factor PgeF [Clostridia bacterium]
MEVYGENLKYIKFNLLKKYEAKIVAGITLRETDFIHVNPSSETFIDARKSICDEFNIEDSSLYFLNQVHGKTLKIVEEDTSNKIEDYDGLITNCSNKMLLTCYADCVPIILYDYEKNIVASVHSGWKGTIAEIGKNAVFTMREKYGSNKENIIACIGPSIGGCCFDVGQDVWQKFADKFPTSVEESSEKVDLKKAVKEQLLNAGIKEENIEVSSICTKCSSDDFYSYRAGDKDKGRFVAFIMIK